MDRNQKLPPILPTPKNVILDGGPDHYKVFTLPSVLAVREPSFEEYAETFRLYAAKLHGLEITRGDGGIYLCRDDRLSGEEYRLECTAAGIFLSASCANGISCALATLHQILRNDCGNLSVPAYTITDKPDCAYRAVMVDLPAYRTLEQMLHYADICHLYKIRYLHLHLADNGGYCLPSRKFLKLPTPGKSFSFEQIEVLKRYCAARNIEIIPEIDVPGHASYLNTTYLELFSDSPDEGEARKDLICIGKPGMLENLRELFREVMEMFPDSRYFHIGGDEAAIDAWNDCADCTAYRKKHGIPDVKVLYTHSIKIITDMVLELGKIPVVWEGFPKDGAEQISRKVIVTAWESLYHLPNELIEEGFTITNSSWMPLYVVHPQSYHAQFVKGGRWHPEDILSDWNIYTWKNWWEKSAAYEKPIVVDPTDQVIGATYCVWLTDYEIELPAVLENLPAMCERLWNINSTLSPEEYAAGLCCLASLAEKLKP